MRRRPLNKAEVPGAARATGASALVLALALGSVAAPASALAAERAAVPLQAEGGGAESVRADGVRAEEPRPDEGGGIIRGGGSQVLSLSWDGTKPVLSSKDADGKTVQSSRSRFLLESRPDSENPGKDASLFTVPPVDPDSDISWIGKPGLTVPAALFHGKGDKQDFGSSFAKPPAGIKPDSLRLSLRQFSGPSWFELGEYRPGYRYTKRMLSSTHPYFKNFPFEGRTNYEPNWTFGAPGEYSITLTLYAETDDGDRVSSNSVTLRWSVTAGRAAEKPSPAPSKDPGPRPSPAPSESSPAPSRPASTSPSHPPSRPAKPAPQAPASDPAQTPSQPKPGPGGGAAADLPPLLGPSSTVGAGEGGAGSGGSAAALRPAPVPNAEPALATGPGAGGVGAAGTGGDQTGAGAPGGDQPGGDQPGADAGAGTVPEPPAAQGASHGSGVTVFKGSPGSSRSGSAGSVGPVPLWAVIVGGALTTGAVVLGALAAAERKRGQRKG